MDYIIKLKSYGTPRKGQIRFVSSGPRGLQGIQGVPGQNGASFVWRGNWATATAYAVNETVYQNGSTYIALVAHTSGTFSSDLSGGKWQLMTQKGLDGTGIGDMTKAVYDAANKAEQVAVDSEVVKKAGSTMTGKLTLNSPTILDSLDVSSDFSGGYNNSDSTGRIHLHSYQRAQLNNQAGTNTQEAHYGEVLRIDMEKQQAKGVIAFRENYLGSSLGPRTVAWLVAHGEANDSTPENPVWHNHFSVELPDENGALQTALEFPFGQFNVPNAFGIPLANQYVRAVRTFIAAGNLVLESPAAGANNMYFRSNTYNDTTSTRWAVQKDGSTEAGSNVGSDWRLNRYNDSGSFVETSIFVKRSNGQVGIGGLTAATTPAVSAKLDVNNSGSYHTIQAYLSSASTVNYAAYSAIIGNAGNKILDARVSGDTTGRVALYPNGSLEFGDGTNARDVNLYRNAANVLKTDDTFVAPNITLGSLNGLLKATAGVISVATSADYAATVKQGLPKTSGGTVQYGLPGAGFTSQNTSAMVVNEVRYVPFVVKYPITLTDQTFEVTAAPASNANVRVGIYLANADLQPTGSALYDAGVAVATGFTGVKTTGSMATNLQPGTYLVAINVDTAMTLRTLASPSQAVSPSLGAAAIIQRYTGSQTYGSFTTATAWTTAGAATAGQQNSIFFKWTE